LVKKNKIQQSELDLFIRQTFYLLAIRLNVVSQNQVRRNERGGLEDTHGKVRTICATHMDLLRVAREVPSGNKKIKKMNTILVLSLVMSYYFIIADGCTCANIQAIEQYLNASSSFPYVAEVKILSKVDNSNGKYNDGLSRYRAQVLTVYNGCLKSQNCPIILATQNSSATCGRSLDNSIGNQYVISFRTGSTSCKNAYDFGLCDYFALSTDLQNTDDMFILKNWKNSCLGVCATGNEVNCFAEPCKTATAPSGCIIAGKRCENNYCNGCNAIWYDDDGTILCHTNVPQQ